MRRWIILLVAATSLAAVATAAAQRDTIRAGIDLVVVPASVRDGDGRFVYDLRREDFSILEDGRVQELSQFSIDPAPLSVAVVLDTGLGGNALRRFAKSILSLSSAFTDLDAVEIYRFDNGVAKMSDFTSNREVLESNLARIQRLAEGKGEGDLTHILIMPGRGPRWLRWLLDKGAPRRVLNDALFAAAVDLEKRPAQNRKVIITISDGQVTGSTHSLGEIRDRLAQSQIQAYGVTLGIAILHGRNSILHAYADATGGDVYFGRTQIAMESAFSRITEQARHQYVLSYVSNNEVPGWLPVQRKIEVRTNRPDVRINHRQTYLQYPRPQ